MIIPRPSPSLTLPTLREPEQAPKPLAKGALGCNTVGIMCPHRPI